MSNNKTFINMENFIKDNTLLAKFVGNDTDEYGDDVFVPRKLLYTPQYNTEQGIFTYGELQFHKSWDWLMLVVEKIEEIEELDVDIHLNGTRIYKWRTKEDIVNNCAMISYDEKIEHTYDAVVKFVKLYFENNGRI